MEQQWHSFPPTGQQPAPPMGGQYYFPSKPPVDPVRQTEEKTLKKSITRTARYLGWGLLLVQLLGTVVALVLPALVDLVFPGASQSGSLYYDAIEYAFFSPLSILLSYWLVAKMGKQKIVDLMPFEKHNPGEGIGCILMAFGLVAVGNYASGWISSLFPQIEENMELLTETQPQTPMELLVYILYVAAIPALVEEFAFRGVTLGMLRPYGDKFAIVISALLFALLHGNFAQIPFAFFVGLALAYATVRTGSVLPAIIIHFLNNAQSCVLGYFEEELTGVFGNLVYLGVYGIWIVLGVAGFLLLRFGYGKKLTHCCQPYTGCISAGRRNLAFFKSAVMIVTVLFYLGTALFLASDLMPMVYGG